LTTSGSAVPGHVTVTTPLSGTVCRPKAGTCYDQHAHQISSCSRDILGDQKI